MRNATQTERDSVDNYIKSISKPTGVNAFGAIDRGSDDYSRSIGAKDEKQGTSMTCDKCKYFKILYEPLRTKGALWDIGRAKCNKHDLITDFANHGKFKRLDTCEDFKPQESVVEE